jgi:hypothetical protein
MLTLAVRVLIGAGVVAGCLGATYAAATLALQRPNAFRIDAALASQLDADYSSDDYAQEARPPLNPEVIDAARTDERALDDGATPQTGNAPAAPVEPAASATPLTGAPSPVAPASTSTPRPLATPTLTPRPEPTDTPEPRPTNTAIASPTMTPRPVTCGAPGFGANDKCRTGTPSITPEPTDTPTPTPVPPTNTPTNTATPRPILGCLLPGLPLLGGGDKCNTHTPTPVADTP